MCRPRILKALLPKTTASVNQLFSSLKNYLQVADVRIKSAFMYPTGCIASYHGCVFGGKSKPLLLFQQKPYPFRRHIPVWLIYESTPSPGEMKCYRWERRNRRQWERKGRDVFDTSLTEVGRLALVVRDCFSCAVKEVTSNGVSSCKQ